MPKYSLLAESALSNATNKFSKLVLASVVVSSAMAPSMAKSAETTKLPTVTVTDSKDKGYNTDSTSLNKLTSPLLDTAQSINVIPRELIEDKGATSMREAIKNVPGISIAAGEGGNQGDNLTLRGFTARSDFFLDGMRDFGNYNRDTFNIENIEILKGPSSILFGRGSTGGVINQESKAAQLGSFNQGSLTFGTDMTKRVTADINHQIDGLEGSAFRLNIMGHDSEVAGRDEIENKRYGFAPTATFGLGTDNRLTLSYFHQTEDNIPDYGIPWVNSRPAKVDRENYYGFSDGHNFFKTNADIGTVKFEHDFNDNMTLREQLRYGHYDRNVQITEPQVTALVTGPLSAVTVTRRQIARDSTETFLANQTDLTTKFETGKIEHTLVTGIELSRETSDPKTITVTGVPGTNLVNPNPSQPYAGTSSVTADASASANSGGVYVIDTLKLNKQWEVTGAVRFDQVESDYSQIVAPALQTSRTDSMPSYRGSIVYKPTPDGSIYVATGTSDNPSIEGLSVTAANANLKPEENQTYEVGTKWDLLNKKLNAIFSVFRVEKTNARTPDPNNALLNVLDGEQRVDGFEFHVTGHLTEAWQVVTGYAFMDSEVITSNTANQVGQRLANVPEHSFSLWSTYTLPSKLELGGGVNYVSSRTSSISPDTITGMVREVPGYVTFDAMAKYPVAKNVDLQLNIYNLTDEYYYDQVLNGHIVPAAGRAALLTTNFKF